MPSILARVVVCLYLAVAVLAVALSAVSTSAATLPALPIGQQVFTTGQTNVRATADGTLVGTQPRFAIGSIESAPTTVKGNSVTWYKVSFNIGVSGWVGADMLIDGIPLPQTTVVGGGFFQNMVLDELGDIEMAYTSSADPNTGKRTYAFSESTNGGLTFSTPSILPALASTDFAVVPPLQGPQIAAERSGAIDIVYTCPPILCPAGIGVPTVELIRSVNHGVTWSNPVQISVPSHPSESGAGDPVIAACGAGVVVAWTDDGIGSNRLNINDDLFVVQVLNGVPGAPINVTYTVGAEISPEMMVNPQGTVYLSWVSGPGNLGPDNQPSQVNFASIPNCAAVSQ